MRSRLGRFRIPPLILPAILVIFAINPGGLGAGDAAERFETARSWLSGQGGALPDEYDTGLPRGTDGRRYAYFGPFQSLLFASLLSLNQALGVARPSTVAKFTYATVCLPLLFGLLAFLLNRMLLRAGASSRSAFLATAGLLFLTPLLQYGRIAQEENIVAIAYVVLVLGVLRIWNGDAGGWAPLGAAAAVALVTRLASAPTLAVLAIALVPCLLRDLRHRAAWLSLALGTLAVSLAAAALMAYNQRRFGSPFESGYGLTIQAFHVPMFSLGSLWSNALPLIASPRRGILLYAPVLAALIAVAPRTLRHSKRLMQLAFLGAAVFAANLLFFASWAAWDGGFGWGPRFLVSPLVFLAPLFVGLAVRSRPLRIAAALSLALQVLSITLPGNTEDYVAVVTRQSGEACGSWTWKCSALGSRPALAARAFANTLAGAWLPTLDEGGTAPAPELLETSDYSALDWWPIRASYRLKRGSPPIALGFSLALVALASWRLLVEWRRLAHASEGMSQPGMYGGRWGSGGAVLLSPERRQDGRG